MTARPLIIPIDFGGSPTACWLRPPLSPRPTPALVEAMIEHYVTERATSGQAVEVAFFRGGVPGDDLLAAAAGLPLRVACSPADLSRADAARLWQRGVRTIELEVCTFRTIALRDIHRGYTGPVAALMLRELQSLGFRVGATLTPGLPNTAHQDAVQDAHIVAGAGSGSDGQPIASFVRLYPALALEGARLSVIANQRRWTPMHLGEAVTTTLAMVEVLEAAGVEIARLGLQPGQDVPHAVAAGPYHPNLRHLIEVRRFYGRLSSVLRFVPKGSRVEVQVNPRDLSWAKGTANENIRALRAQLSLQELKIRPAPHVERGDVQLSRVV